MNILITLIILILLIILIIIVIISFNHNKVVLLLRTVVQIGRGYVFLRRGYEKVVGGTPSSHGIVPYPPMGFDDPGSKIAD